jgi:hypothetical protein
MPFYLARACNLFAHIVIFKIFTTHILREIIHIKGEYVNIFCLFDEKSVDKTEVRQDSSSLRSLGMTKGLHEDDKLAAPF